MVRHWPNVEVVVGSSLKLVAESEVLTSMMREERLHLLLPVLNLMGSKSKLFAKLFEITEESAKMSDTESDGEGVMEEEMRE